MNKMVDALESAADGAFIVDEQLEIVYANEAAQQTLKITLEDDLPVICSQILGGRDELERRICSEFCPVARQILNGKKVSSFDLNISGYGNDMWVNMSVFRYFCDQNQKAYIVHLFRDISREKRDVRLIEQLVEVAKKYHKVDIDPDGRSRTTQLPHVLTAREREVLSLLADGYNTSRIAHALSISVNTTRNHIQNILGKLDVHTRVEAVVYALNHGLVSDTD